MNIDAFHPLVLNVGKAFCNADWNWKNVCSPFARIYYIESGQAMVEMQGQKHRLVPGYLYLIPPFVTHSTSCKGSLTIYYIHVYDGENTWNGLFEEYDFPFEVKSQKDDALLFERLSSLNPDMVLRRYDPQEYDNQQTLVQSVIQNKQRSEWLKMESRGIVYQLCSRFMAYATAKPYTRDDRILKSIRYIHANLDKPISIKEMAAEANLSIGYFIRLFTEATSTSPKLFVNQKRIEKAQLLLHTTKLPIKEIALQLGYPDNSYFVRVFKRGTGITPSAYRNQIEH